MLVRPLIAVTLLCLAAPATAETLTINGSDPAGANVNDLLRIAVERFEGEDGAAMAQQLEAELGNARFGGRSYYRIVAPESGAPTDGLVTGTTRASVDEVPVTEKRKRCVERDTADKKKCLKEAEVDIRCRRRTITVTTTARLVAIGDGSIRYTRPPTPATNRPCALTGRPRARSTTILRGSSAIRCVRSAATWRRVTIRWMSGWRKA